MRAARRTLLWWPASDPIGVAQSTALHREAGRRLNGGEGFTHLDGKSVRSSTISRKLTRPLQVFAPYTSTSHTSTADPHASDLPYTGGFLAASPTLAAMARISPTR